MKKDDLVTLLLYEPGRKCWSNMAHKYFISNNIENQFWAHEGIRFKCLQVTLEEAVKIVLENPGKTKAERNAIWLIMSPECPDSNNASIKDWSGYVFVDLDLSKSPRIVAMTPEMRAIFYKQLDLALQELCPNNFKYIEHSSSGIGIHCIFYFDCEKNEENHSKFTRWIYNIFRYDIDEYIKDFSHIFTMKECLKTNGKSKVFDEVYNRPFQKLYITGIDYIMHDCSGECSDIEVEPEPEKAYKPEKETIGKVNISYTSKKKWDLDHNDRFFVLTALKKYCDRETAYKLWYDFCQDISLYKRYRTKDFVNMFESYWDNKLDPSKGHLSILKKYGFKVDDKEIHYYLNENEWLEKVFPDIVENCEMGINMSVAGTGVGKNQSLININEKWSDPFERMNHKPVLVIEPMNSIVASKYDEAKFRIVIGSRKIGKLDGYEMIITNYNHLITRSKDGNYEVRHDIKEFFGQFELVIIDESHIMMKDAFRAEVLIPFMNTIGEIDNTKVIIQTATPMFEQSVLNIKKTFIVHKEERSTKKIIFREWVEDEEKKTSILDLTCLADYYINNGKKVYIYWSNGSSQQMKMFKDNYHDPDKVAIYHKRLTGEPDMTYITEEHLLDKKDILISSCYFGVGNDLNDEIENAAVIVVGANSWQEDLQAIGRWRNAKHIECCIVLDKYDVDEAKSGIAYSFNDLYRKFVWEFTQKWNDKTNRDKSVIINRTTFMITCHADIDILAKMKASSEYSKQFKVKRDEFERRGYDVREAIKPLVSNVDYTERLKEWSKKRKQIHNEQINEMVNNDSFDYEEINKDTKMERVARVIKKLKANNLLELADINSVSSILRYESYLRYLGANIKTKYDYAELFSIIWTVTAIHGKVDNKKEVGAAEVPMEDYLTVCGYLIWWSYRNENEEDVATSWNYFTQFRRTVRDFMHVSQPMIDRLFAVQYGNEEFDEEREKFYSAFFNIEVNKITEENIVDRVKQIAIKEEDYSSVFWKLIEFINPDKKSKSSLGGKVGGGKPKMKVMDLETGKTYDSKTACAHAIGKSCAYVTKYNNRFIPA